MATEAQIRAAVKAKIQAVANVGPVHDYLRYAKNNGALATLFKNTTSGRLNGWQFLRESFRRIEVDIGLYRRLDTWRVYGFMAIDDADASGHTLQAQLESIAGAFLADRTLGGLVLDLADMTERAGRVGLQAELIEPWFFAGVLTLRARCLLITETEE